MLARQKRSTIVVQEVSLELLDDVSKLHLTFPQSMTILLIKVLIRSIALSVLWLVRWV
jgi:hypothetical protein